MAEDIILGTYDLEKKVEDTCILLELTHKNYGDPERAVLIEQSIKQLVEQKYNMSKAHRYALVGFGEDAKVFLDFDDWTGPESIVDALYNKIELLGYEAHFSKGLKVAFDIVVKSMQKLLEGKTFRILVISEGEFVEEAKPEWEQMADVASKVGLYIDAVKLGYNDDFTLKRIAQMTSGDYVECDVGELRSWLPSFAADKKQLDINKSEADKNLKGLLELIAKPLITIKEQIKHPKDLLHLLDNTKQENKCGICYSDYCMICKGPPYACGAYCPNCGRFFHLHCAAGWAENSKDTPNNVLKCPVCFSLLKVPGELYRVKVLKGRLKEELKPPTRRYPVRHFKARELGEEWFLETCAACGNIFDDPEEEVYQCGNPECGALYHQDCFEHIMESHEGRCRVCDYPLQAAIGVKGGLQRII